MIIGEEFMIIEEGFMIIEEVLPFGNLGKTNHI